jgi:hypothetical protein
LFLFVPQGRFLPSTRSPGEVNEGLPEHALEAYIFASNALNNCLDRIQSLSREQKVMYQNMTTIEQALEELKDLPFEED